MALHFLVFMTGGTASAGARLFNANIWIQPNFQTQIKAHTNQHKYPNKHYKLIHKKYKRTCEREKKGQKVIQQT